MDSHFWNRPAGATITKDVTCLRWLRAISGNSAVIQRQFWPTGFTRPAPTGHSVRKRASAYPALGRPKAGETDRKQKRQIYKDACDRNAVEGRNGNAKRRFGLDLIAAKLDETAKTEAALILIAMNAAHRLARWLLRFFINWRFFKFLMLLGEDRVIFQ